MTTFLALLFIIGIGAVAVYVMKLREAVRGTRRVADSFLEVLSSGATTTRAIAMVVETLENEDGEDLDFRVQLAVHILKTTVAAQPEIVTINAFAASPEQATAMASGREKWASMDAPVAP